MYFRGRNFRRQKVSRFLRILDKFPKVSPVKNIFVKILESLSHAKWTSKANLMEIVTDLLEYAKKLSNFTT